MAQNRSAFSLSLARILLPSAVTTSAETRLSMVMPYLRVDQPNPPPSVRPAMPVVELIPTGVANPWDVPPHQNRPVWRPLQHRRASSRHPEKTRPVRQLAQLMRAEIPGGPWECGSDHDGLWRV